MSTTTVPARLGRVCKRYGPGRLPGSDRPAVGAGYAFLTAALSATVLFHAVTVAAQLPSGMASLQSSYTAGAGFFGLLAVPFVIPAAFAAGVVASWRVPEEKPHRGPVVGLFATVLTYVFAAPLVAGALVASGLSESVASISITGALILSTMFVVVGFFLTCLLTVPLGVVSGWMHEQAVVAETSG
jgi:hypothetical protein